MSAWLLPDHIADVLPSEARHIEELRRALLDTARGYGYELVMPPLLEHLESLLTGTGEALTCRPSSWSTSSRAAPWACAPTPRRRWRASTPTCSTAAPSPACACGPVLHTPRAGARHARAAAVRRRDLRPRRPEADLEVLRLALDCLGAASVQGLNVDLADARIVRACWPA
jgi:ATP phosphoribosyltransferase regulatory subunit